jgi:nucleoside-diphosphate-sugar epimerase
MTGFCLTKNNAKEKILVTGGLGYIASHTVVELISAGLNAWLITPSKRSKNFCRVTRTGGQNDFPGDCAYHS